jgi:hypothetical protein
VVHCSTPPFSLPRGLSETSSRAGREGEGGSRPSRQQRLAHTLAKNRLKKAREAHGAIQSATQTTHHHILLRVQAILPTPRMAPALSTRRRSGSQAPETASPKALEVGGRSITVLRLDDEAGEEACQAWAHQARAEMPQVRELLSQSLRRVAVKLTERVFCPHGGRRPRAWCWGWTASGAHRGSGDRRPKG